jgi:hypothetical protein
MNQKIIIGFIDFLILITIVFITVKSVLALDLVIHIPEKYLEVVAGKQLAFELNIKYPENYSQKDLHLTYQIKKDNQIISETKALKSIENQSSFMEYLPIPESAQVGTYTITNQIQDYETINEQVSTNFRVIKDSTDFIKYIYILIITVVMVAILVTVQFFMILRINKSGIRS